MAATYHTNLFNRSTNKVYSRAQVTPAEGGGYLFEFKPELPDHALDTVELHGGTIISQSSITRLMINAAGAMSLDSGRPYRRSVIDIVTSPAGEAHPEDAIAARGINVAREVMQMAFETPAGRPSFKIVK